MAYAQLAGLPPITGLYTTIVCLFAYAIAGPSPYLVLGPDSALGPIIAAAILPIAAGDESQQIALAGALALLVGLIAVVAGVARLGFVSDLLSSPVRTGYLAGLAVAILIGQLPKLFGFSVVANGAIDELRAFVANLDRTNVWALSIGLLCLAIVLGFQRFAPRMPGILVAVVVSLVASIALDLQSKGVSVIGVLPQGFPVPSIPAVPLSDVPLLLGAAVGIALVAIGDSISTSGAFASRGRYAVDPNQELVAIGSANLGAGLFSGFPVTTSGSRTAVAEQSGAKTQLTGVVAGLLVLMMIVFAPWLVQALPYPVLAAIVIAASVRLFDAQELRRLYRVRGAEFALAVICGAAVAVIGVLEGIVIAVALSVLYIFKRAWQPHWAILGKPDGVAGYHDIRRFPGGARVPGLVIVRWSAPLFFANANLFREAIRAAVRSADHPPRWVLIAAAPITDIDTTAGAMLADLDLELNASGIHMAFAELTDAVREWIVRYGLLETIDQSHIYRSIDEAVAAFLAETG
jgi:high affinity sulfate transporter 1